MLFPTLRARALRCVLLGACLCGSLMSAAPVGAAPPALDGGASAEALARALSRANAAVVGLRAVAVDDARSAQTLGPVREGSGVVIGDDGLVLTIGYLILEAEHVELLLEGEHVVPARVIAYDSATGFGLVQALVPLRLPAAPLGEAARLTGDDLLMIASGGDDGDVSMARLVSRRPYTGYWEYHIDAALYTVPARRDHSGAGLFNERGELIGIGSLAVNDAVGDDHPAVPGNMFVPVDLLKPIYGELRERGSSTPSHRPWMGLTCAEQGGEVRVVRVSEDSPADAAGLERGDLILAIDGMAVHSIETLWKTLWRGDGAERDVQLEIRRGDDAQKLAVHAVDRMTTLRRARGI